MNVTHAGLIVAVCGAALPLTAQRTTRTVSAPTSRLVAADTGGRSGSVLDFQDQDLKVVLSALAEAGNLNMTYSNLPSRKVTLRMGQTADRAEIVSMVKSIAEANDLKVVDSGTLLQVIGPAPAPAAPTQFQQQQQAVAAAQLNLYTYRLKHASATAIAPVLSALFANTTTGANGVTIPTTSPTTTIPGVVNNNNLSGFGGGGGRGGRGAAGNGGGVTAFGNNGGGITALGGVGGVGNNPLAQLQQIFGGAAAASQVRIVGEESSNTILVRSTATDWLLMQQVLAAVDARPLQVLIEVTIAEVSRTTDLNVGLSGSASRNSGKSGDTASIASAASAQDFILKLAGQSGTVDFNVALNALQSRGNTRVLSLPVIIAQNNKQAVLTVGESRPFVSVNQSVTTGTVPTTVQTVQYIDVATTLTITPTINLDGYVNLAVDQADNSVTTEQQFDAPVISKREATTQVFLRDGQTTVIGGLAGKSTSKTVSGIPILSKIPIIGGWLFGHTTSNNTTSELFLFLTPHIIMNDMDVDQLREELKENSDLLKQVQTVRIVPRPDTLHLMTADSVRRADSIRHADSVQRNGGRGGQ